MTKRAAIYVRVSTDDQRDNGYSIDSQLRILTKHCEKNEYSIIHIYNDAGYSGKDLIKPNMQRLIKDIKAKKIDILLAIKVDRLTRNNYDGFWLLNYCQDNNVKIKLTLEPFDVSTANGEMMFGMNLVFGQRERKEFGARTKRALEEMALKHVHPSQAPYGYTRNSEGYLEIEPIEAQVVKEVFDLCKKWYSVRNIAKIMKENNAYLTNGIWHTDRVYRILSNSIYIGRFEYWKYKRKNEDILIVDDYCEPTIDKQTWNKIRKILEKNKHSNYGEHIHLFTSLIECPKCKKILSSTISYKYDKNRNRIEYYHLTCKNNNCKNKGLHYSSDKIEKALTNLLKELIKDINKSENTIIINKPNNQKEIKDIEKALENLKIQEKKLIDLYLNSSLNIEILNQKNEMIKNEINKLNEKKELLSTNNSNKETKVDLINCLKNNNKNIDLNLKWEQLDRRSKREIIKKNIEKLEIIRDKKYNIEIKNIVFTEEFISNNNKNFIEYINFISKKITK